MGIVSPCAETGLSLKLRVGGAHITLHPRSVEELSALARMWGRGVITDRNPSEDDQPGLENKEVTDDLVNSVTSAVIDAGRGRQMMFHAAGLADTTNGRTVALVAPSGTGKTTICAALGPQFGYVTDETLIIDPGTLQVTPFPKPLSVLSSAGRRPKFLRSPDDLGLLHPPGDPTLHAVVLLDRNPHHAGPPELEILPLSKALPSLIPQTSALCALERGLMGLCSTLDQLGGVFRLHYAEAESCLELISGLLTHDPQADMLPQWEPVPSEELPGTTDSRSGTLLRAEVDDAVYLDDHSLAILHQEQFTLLSGLGPSVWETAGSYEHEDQLISVLSAGPSAPDDAVMLLKQAVEELVNRGLLLRA